MNPVRPNRINEDKACIGCLIKKLKSIFSKKEV